jgi:hypothetical protein
MPGFNDDWFLPSARSPRFRAAGQTDAPSNQRCSLCGESPAVRREIEVYPVDASLAGRSLMLDLCDAHAHERDWTRDEWRSLLDREGARIADRA